MAANRRTLRFVRALIAVREAKRGSAGTFTITTAERTATLEAAEVRALIGAGVLTGEGSVCRASENTINWLRRELAETDGFAAQHRHELRASDGQVVDLAESPLARLAVPASGKSEAFLAPHQVETGERVRRLAERAQLQPRVTMSYSGAHTASRKGFIAASEISDMAAEARKLVAEISVVLPRDCAGVVLDVCGLLKGLQTVETERGWPRRSAKLVLRIGLDQLAQHYGLSPHATGPASSRNRVWLGEKARPERFE